MDRETASTVIESLYGSFYSTLLSYASRTTGDADLAEDAVQECFLELYKALCRGVPIASPKAWAVTVVRRLTYKQVRRRPDAIDLTDGRPVPEQIVAPLRDGGETESLTHLLSCLTPREGQVLLLRMQDLKYREIAGPQPVHGIGCHPSLRASRKLRRAASAVPAPVARITELQ